MQKDVIYIDTEDDITAIIGKVKDSSQKIVALVPPKRIGAMQSAVNLKLVQRAAEQAGKRLVIITGNQALSTLAASASIPTARTLQSRPEMAEIPALEVDDEDVIDGSELEPDDPEPVTPATSVPARPATRSAARKTPDDDDKAADTSAASDLKKKVKVPDFNKMRKKLLIGGAALVVLIVFLVWAIFFAPHATITIQARTSDLPLSTRVTIGDSLGSNLQEGTIKTTTKTTRKTISIDFTATGKEDVGAKATGTVRFTPASFDVLRNGATIDAGTTITSENGMQYKTTSSVVFDSNASGGDLMRGRTTEVTAVESGTKYNGASGSAKGPSGFSVSFTHDTSGGTDKTITTVQRSDIEQARNRLNSSLDSNGAKRELASQFNSDSYIILGDTFKQNDSDIQPNVKVGGEATDGKAQLTGAVEYSLSAIEKREAGIFLDAYFKQQIDGKANQQVHSNGVNKLSVTNVSANGNAYNATITTNGKIGPKVDESELKDYAKGKRYAEIRSHVEKIEGVSSADVSFSPFWVQSAPNDTNRIKVVFDLNEQ